MNLPIASFLLVLSASVCVSNAEAQTTISAPAHVVPYERAELFAKASGFVARVHVDIGDEVEKGQLLAELSIPEMVQEQVQKQALVEQTRAAIRQAEAGVSAAKAEINAANANVAASEYRVKSANAHLEKYKADVAFAESELSRISILVNARAVNAALQDEKQQQVRAAKSSLSRAVADIEFAQANVVAERSTVQVSEANLQQAEAKLAHAHSQTKVAEAALGQTVSLMEYAKIKAPFSGQISHRGIDTGDFVISAASSHMAAASLFVLNRIDQLRVVFDAPESSANQVQIGQTVELKVDSIKDHTFTGTIVRTTGELDQRTRTLRVEAAVEDRNSQLRVGMFGTIVVTIARAEHHAARSAP